MERQQNYTIAEQFSLPSGGKIYSKPINPQVELRSMTARDEMKRQSPAASQFKMLAEIIDNCLIEKLPISVYDMALGDYEYLLHRLRVVTYGDEYVMSLKCPFCGQLIDTKAHLDELTVKEFDIDVFNNLRTIKLPKCGDTVTIGYQTPRVLDQIETKEKEYRRKFKDATIDFTNMIIMVAAIEDINGEPADPRNIETYVNNLPAADMMKILNGIEAVNNCIGLNQDLTVDCSACGKEIKTFFRFGPEFFRPSNI